jgi:hypothetical protein
MSDHSLKFTFTSFSITRPGYFITCLYVFSSFLLYLVNEVFIAFSKAIEKNPAQGTYGHCHFRSAAGFRTR